MTGRLRLCIAVGVGCAASCICSAAQAIETTYGEDPVPNSKCYDGFINLGYGIDPIPAKSPYVRWQEWRASRGLAPTVGPFKRQVGQSRFRTYSAPAAPSQPAAAAPPRHDPSASSDAQPRSSRRAKQARMTAQRKQ